MSTNLAEKKAKRKERRKRQRAKKKSKTLKKSLNTDIVVHPNGRISMTGRGDYLRIPGKTPMKGNGDYFAPDYFDRLGEAFFGDKGRIVGEGVGSVLRAFGLGDYEVKKNTLLNPGQLELKGSQSVPRITNSPGGEVVRVRKEEYIGDLYTGTGSPTAFTLDTFDLNPANPALFPWLSVIANNFEEYEFKGLIVTLKTMASDVSTAQSLGTMFGATQYDIDDPPFTNKQELLNYYFANSVKISDTVLIPVECDRKQNVLQHLYVPTGNIIPDGADSKFYNLGILSLGTYGCPGANSPVAEVWISYEVDFYKPKLALGGELGLGLYSAVWTSTTPTLSAPFTGAVANSGNNFPGSIGTSSISLPEWMEEGLFQITYRLRANTTGAITGFSSPVYTNCVGYNWSSGSDVLAAPDTGTTTRTAMCSIVVSITGEGASVVVPLLTAWTGVTLQLMDVTVSQLNGNLASPLLAQIEEESLSGKRPHLRFN
jgi:hypothetical protein